MTDTTTLDNRIATLLAGDTTTLAQATNANLVCLIASPFTPGPGLQFSSLTEATFTGYAALAAALNAQSVYNDPVTFRRVIEILPPAGGWVYVCTAAPTPAQVIYGYVLTNHAKTTIYGMQLLPTPVTIGNIGDGVNLGSVQFNLLQYAMI